MTDNIDADEASQWSETPAPMRILRADNGCEVSLDELRRTGERPLVWAANERNRIVVRRLTGHLAANKREVLRVGLASGRRLDLSAGCALVGLNGLVPTQELMVGGRVAVLRHLPPAGELRPMHESEIILLAHMIGDGSCVKRQPIRYASIDEANLAAVTIAAAHFGVTPIRDEYAVARVITLRLPAPYRLTHGKRNPIAAWLDGLGLFGLRSYEKFIPAEVFALPTEQIELFLRHLWATDGSVRWDAKTQQGRVYYASTSRRLVDGLMYLLLRVGVQGRITRIQKPGYRDCWHVTIDRADNQTAFLTKVGVHGERGVKAKEVVVQAAGRVRRPGTDTIPTEVWDRVHLLMKQRRWSDRDFAYRTGTRYDGSLMWTHAPGRVRLHRIANVFNDSELHDIATSSVYWDKIVTVSPMGVHEVCEIEDEATNRVVMQGVLVACSRI